MKSVATFLAILVVTLFDPSAAQANKTSSLPFSALAARSVYVDNQTASAELQNTAYIELSRWGRFEIVDSPKKADLVIRLSGGTSVRFAPGGQNSPVAQSSSLLPAKQGSMSADEDVPEGSTRVSLVDPKSGNSLWTGICKTNSPKAAAHLLDGLRAAFDQKK
jgi:hypothetical protein